MDSLHTGTLSPPATFPNHTPQQVHNQAVWDCQKLKNQSHRHGGFNYTLHIAHLFDQVIDGTNSNISIGLLLPNPFFGK